MRNLKLASAFSWLVVRAQPALLACTVCALVSLAAERPPAPNVRLGEALTIKGQTYFVEKVEGGKLLLTLPQPPTAALGAFITPVDARAKHSQDSAGRTPERLIDGSGWGEIYPGSGVYVHTANVYEGGSSMWNGAWDSWLRFDLGREYRVSGMYIWNYNEGSGWNNRSVKELEVAASLDGEKFDPVGMFTLAMALGKDDYCGETVAFKAPVRARYFRFEIKANYRGGEFSGLAEVRFANAEQKAVVGRATWQPTYARPEHPRVARGEALPGAANFPFPADAGIVDVTRAPYNARGDGLSDDTAAIQKALDDYPNKGAIIYLPNGRYLVSDTLRWPHGGGNGAEEKNTVLWGQSRAGAVLQLRDECAGYENPRKPKAVIWTGEKPAQRFGNELHHLTIDTGAGNPGACGVQFIANNQGGIYDVSIVSGDGQGVIGLDMGYTDEQGPCLIKNVSVLGFDIGVHTATGVASETLEHITVAQQNQVGFRNDGQPCTVRGLVSRNEVPAFMATGGFNVLVDSTLEGFGRAASQPAVVNDAGLVIRNVRTSGYKTPLANRKNSPSMSDIDGTTIRLFLSTPPVFLFEGSRAAPLGLPIEETPDVPWDDGAAWIAPQKFGANADDDRDDSEALQRAIDAGATTVYLPRGTYVIGRPVIVRGAVRRLIGCKATLVPGAPLCNAAEPMLRVDKGAAPVVVIEGLSTDFSSGRYCFLENNAERTLVLRRLQVNFQGADAYHGAGRGRVFLDDVVGRGFFFAGQTVWARQLNPEGDGTHIVNDGGTLWILGLKTEGIGTLVETKAGGATEVLGGFSYTVGDPKRQAPMFVVDKARATFCFAEVCFTDAPFATLVREVRGGDTRELKPADPRWEGHFTLFSAAP